MSITDKVTGKVKQAVGDLTDDSSLRREGRDEQRKGEKKEELHRAEDRADRKAAEVATSSERPESHRLSSGSKGPAVDGRALLVLHPAGVARPPVTQRPRQDSNLRPAA